MSNNLPDVSYRTQVFYQSGFWTKPPGITMIHIIVIGAGGGGGSGLSTALGVIASGGGGGGGGANIRYMIPADLVHDSLRVTVGVGGNGGIPPFNGANGGATIVQGYYRNDASGNYVIARVLGGSGGNAAGAGGVGGGGSTEQEAPYSKFSVAAGQVGPTGTAGGSGAIGTNFIYGTTSLQPSTSGAGGGGKNTSNVGFSGGSIVGAGIVLTIDGGAAEGGNGQNGSSSITPFYQLGGSGGGGSGTGTGGNGGNGAIGCGGGGGGAGITGGLGGRGGDGLVIINCW